MTKPHSSFCWRWHEISLKSLDSLSTSSEPPCTLVSCHFFPCNFLLWKISNICENRVLQVTFMFPLPSFPGPPRTATSDCFTPRLSHPSTNQAQPCLASEIRRDRARSGWCGRRLPKALITSFIPKFCSSFLICPKTLRASFHLTCSQSEMGLCWSWPFSRIFCQGNFSLF